jgi:hypothetical protein
MEGERRARSATALSAENAGLLPGNAVCRQVVLRLLRMPPCQGLHYDGCRQPLSNGDLVKCLADGNHGRAVRTCSVQRGDLTLSNLQILNAILYVAEPGSYGGNFRRSLVAGHDLYLYESVGKERRIGSRVGTTPAGTECEAEQCQKDDVELLEGVRRYGVVAVSERTRGTQHFNGSGSLGETAPSKNFVSGSSQCVP